MTIDEWIAHFQRVAQDPDFLPENFEPPPALDDGPLDPSFPDDPKFDAIRKFVENFNRNWRRRRDDSD